MDSTIKKQLKKNYIKFEAHNFFTLGEQLRHPEDCNQWHNRRMERIKCSLSGFASGWFLRILESYKKIGLPSYLLSKEELCAQKNCILRTRWKSSCNERKETENVRHHALKLQQLVEKGWGNESAATITHKCSEKFTRGSPKKFINLAQNWQIKHTTTVLEPSNPFQTLVKFVDAGVITDEKACNFD